MQIKPCGGHRAARAWRELSTATPGDSGVRSGMHLLHQPGTAIKKRQHFVGPSRLHVENQSGHTRVAVALDQVRVLGDAEDRDWDGRRVTPGCRSQLLKVGQKIEHVAIGWTAGVWHPAVAIGDGSACPVWISPAN